MTSRNLPFIPFPPFLGDSHSQRLQIAQVVKDPGRELGEGVVVEVPIDSPHNHPRSPSHMTYEEEEEEGGGNE